MLKVAGRLNVGVIFAFLTAEALVDKVDEDPLAEVAEFHHALTEESHALLGFLHGQKKLADGFLDAFDFLAGGRAALGHTSQCEDVRSSRR